MVSRAEQDRIVDGLAASFDSKLDRSIIEAFQSLQDSFDLSEIESLIEDGNIRGVIALLEDSLFEESFEETRSLLSQAFIVGGVIAGLGVLRTAVPTISINFTPTSTIQNQTIINEQIATRIQQITEETRRIVQIAINNSLFRGDSPRKTALAFRSAIGLTEQNVQAVQSFRGFLETGSPEALRRSSRDRRFDSTVRRAIEGQVVLQQGQIDNMVNAFERKMIAARALTIARTESLRAVNQGKERIIQQAVEDGLIDGTRVRRFWINSGDDKVRNSHNAIPLINADGVGLLETFVSPLGPIRFPTDPLALPKNTINCFLPDTKIEGDITTALKSFYSGDVITIETRSRRKLTITPNHPILTNSGFVPARSLNKGDNLFCKRNHIKESCGIVSGDNQSCPTNARQIFSSFSDLSKSFTARGSTVNFHGDEKFIQGNVEIISINSLLQSAFISLVNESFENLSFKQSDIRLGFFMRKSQLNSFFVSGDSTFTSFIGSRNLPHDGICSLDLNFLPFFSFRFGLSSTLNIIFQKYSSYTSSISPQQFADAILRFSSKIQGNDPVNIERDGSFNSNTIRNKGSFDFTMTDTKHDADLSDSISRLIEIDDIIDIKISHYEGPVFDFSTTSGYLIADDITVSNCRCTIFHEISQS